MRKLKLFFILALIANSFWGCEKDDICDASTPTTPRMIIEFYDDNNPTVKKNVNNLGVVADGFTEGILFNAVSKIEIPLKTTEDTTEFSFILDANNVDVNLRNEDKLTINYTRSDVFISRACGYKTLFTLNDSNGITLSPDSNNWIQEIVIQKYNILNEDEIHVKIFF